MGQEAAHPIPPANPISLAAAAPATKKQVQLFRNGKRTLLEAIELKRRRCRAHGIDFENGAPYACCTGAVKQCVALLAWRVQPRWKSLAGIHVGIEWQMKRAECVCGQQWPLTG